MVVQKRGKGVRDVALQKLGRRRFYAEEVRSKELSELRETDLMSTAE